MPLFRYSWISSEVWWVSEGLITSQTYLLSPTCVAWKNELMAAGDTEGVLFFQDNKTNVARCVSATTSALLVCMYLIHSVLLVYACVCVSACVSMYMCVWVQDSGDPTCSGEEAAVCSR